MWRPIFAINLPLGPLAIYLLLAKVPADCRQREAQLDLGGAALATPAFGALAYGLTSMSAEGDGLMHRLPVHRRRLRCSRGLLFGARQREPMIDLSLFRIRAFAGANVATSSSISRSRHPFLPADAADLRLGADPLPSRFDFPSIVGGNRSSVRSGRGNLSDSLARGFRSSGSLRGAAAFAGLAFFPASGSTVLVRRLSGRWS